MAKETYIARDPIRHGLDDGTTYVLSPGDELPPEIDEAAVLQLRQAGSAVPRAVWQALDAAEKAQHAAETAQEQANREAAEAATRVTETSNAATSQLDEAQSAAGAPERASTPAVRQAAPPRAAAKSEK